MAICIYCRRNASEPFPAEHVIPRSFGLFKGGLTLRCVCGDCNHFFSRELELRFARETGESIVRFQHGLRSGVAGYPGGKLTASINVPGPMFGARVLLAPSNGAKSMEIVYLPQVGFASQNSDDWKWYLREELNKEVLKGLGTNIQVRYLFSSTADEQLLRAHLRSLGFSPNSRHVSRTIVPPGSEINARVTYTFDVIIRRCVAKIAFNYLAHAVGENARILLRSDFDVIREFVREGVLPREEIVFVVGGPRLDQESRLGSLVDGHMIAVGWNEAEHILCNLSVFNAMTYQVVLSRKHQGLWFPLRNAHSFDLETRKARSLPGHLMVPVHLWNVQT